jgi:hypothetical protein
MILKKIPYNGGTLGLLKEKEKILCTSCTGFIFQ